jgi:hypothetical protein
MVGHGIVIGHQPAVTDDSAGQLHRGDLGGVGVEGGGFLLTRAQSVVDRANSVGDAGERNEPF